MYACLYGTHRQLQFLGYLLIGIILQKSHFEECAILLRERVYVVLNLRALLQTYELLLGRWGTCPWSCKSLIYRQVLLSASLIIYVCVACYGVYPLTKRIAVGVAVQVYIYFDKRLLQQIVGIYCRCESLQEELPYRFAIAIEEVLKGCMVALE